MYGVWGIVYIRGIVYSSCYFERKCCLPSLHPSLYFGLGTILLPANVNDVLTDPDDPDKCTFLVHTHQRSYSLRYFQTQISFDVFS